MATPTDETTARSPLGVHEVILFHLRALIHEVRQPLAVAQRRFKRKYNARVRLVNEGISVRDSLFVGGHTNTKEKLGTHVVGPHKVLGRGNKTFWLDIGDYPETVSRDHVTAAPDMAGDIQNSCSTMGRSQILWSPRRTIADPTILRVAAAEELLRELLLRHV